MVVFCQVCSMYVCLLDVHGRVKEEHDTWVTSCVLVRGRARVPHRQTFAAAGLGGESENCAACVMLNKGSYSCVALQNYRHQQ